jgi:hypothetical protein
MTPGLPMDEGIPTSMKTTTLVAIKRGLLLYWSLWFTIVFATTLLGGLEALGAIDKGWKLAGGDFTLISPAAAIYGVPARASGVLLVCLMVWEGITVAAFWRAFRKFRGLENADARALAAAFILATSLFAALLLADRFLGGHLFIATHLKILVALLVSLLVVFFLPE